MPWVARTSEGLEWSWLEWLAISALFSASRLLLKWLSRSKSRFLLDEAVLCCREKVASPCLLKDQRDQLDPFDLKPLKCEVLQQDLLAMALSPKWVHHHSKSLGDVDVETNVNKFVHLDFHNVHHPLLDVHDQLTAHGFDVFVLWRFGSPAGWNLRKRRVLAEGWNAKGGRCWKYDFHQALLPNDPPKQDLHVRLEMSLCLTWTVKISTLLHVPTPDIPESVEKCLAANVNPSELGVFQHGSPKGIRRESLEAWKWQRDAMFIMPTTFHLSTRISWTNFNGTIALKKAQISNHCI